MIVYRDQRNGGGGRYPHSLVGAPSLNRAETAEGALVWMGDPLLRPDPAAIAWEDLPDLAEGGDWQVGVTGAAIDSSALWRTHPSMRFHLVSDGQGRLWQVPAVLLPSGESCLVLPVRVTGYQSEHGFPTPIFSSVPTQDQQRLIAAAQVAHDTHRLGRLAELDRNTAAGIAITGLQAGQFASGLSFALTGILDDRLIVRALLAMGGFPLPEEARE